MTDINVDSTVTLINSMIPVLIAVAVLSMLLAWTGKLKL